MPRLDSCGTWPSRSRPPTYAAAADTHLEALRAALTELPAGRADMSDDDLAALVHRHRQGAVVLSAIKSTVKGGLGKLRERPQGRHYKDGERWPALERPTWRPDIRAVVIAKARVNMHRKMAKLAALTGQYPLAVLSDCVVYASPGPSPLDFLPTGGDGTAVYGTFRVGANPGLCKVEGVQETAWAVDLMEQGYNPAQELGITQRSVERYRTGARKQPPKAIADRIDTAVRARWQPRVRDRRRKQAATRTGITVEARARFGYRAPIGTTDDGRTRRITVHLPADYARRLFDAQQGIGDQSPNEVIAEGIQETYFKDHGRRADHLEVEFTDIDYIDISL